MAVDVHGQLARGGFVGATAHLLQEWWRIPLPRPPADASQLLTVLQAAAHRLPWPQDRLLPDPRRSIQWGPVLAEENQVVWEAVPASPPDGPAEVAFIVDDGRHRLDERMPLDELLFRLTVGSAAFAGPTQLRYRPSPDPAPFERSLLVERWSRQRGAVQFPALFGGPGWIARGAGQVATNEPAAELVRSLQHLGDEWQERVLVQVDTADVPAGVSPWDDIRALGGWIEEWRPVPQPPA